MPSPNETELQSLLWQRFQTIHARQRLAHAVLLIGSESENLINFAQAMSAAILCGQGQKPCNECKSCRLIGLREHPDVAYLVPDKSGGLIKIDQIRDLHGLAFTSPQLGDKRIIILYPAEKMNAAAANALLKLLEEPPSTLQFFLIAEQISSLPATIISRCQQWRFTQADKLDSDYFSLAQNANIDSGRGLLFKQLPLIIEGLAALIANKISICALAEKWSSYEFNHLIWMLYLLNCQLINYKLKGRGCEKNWTEQLYQLAQDFKPVHLFRQLDQLNAISKKLQQHINVNQLLVLENLLQGWVQLK